MKTITLRSLTATATLAAIPFALAAAGSQIRLQPEVGKTYRYVMTQKQAMNTDLGPMGSQAADNTMRMEYSQTVKDRGADGATSFEFVYDRMVMDVKAGPSTMHFDSADAPAEGKNDPLGGVLGTLVGKAFGITMSPRGEILAVSGFEALWDEMTAEMATDPMSQQLAESLKASFGEEGMKQLMQTGAAVFPENAVATGDTWSDTLDTTNPVLGNISVASTYTLEAAESKSGRDCHRLAVATTMKFGGEMPMLDTMKQMMAAQGAEVSMDIEAGDMSGTGTIWVDKETGMTVASDLDQKMAFKVNMSMTAPNAPEPMNLAMAIDMDQKILVELAQ